MSEKSILNSFQFWSLRVGILSLAVTVPLSFESIANARPIFSQTPNTEQESLEAGIFYVNPDTGNDRSGNGTAKSPFKTITHALTVAPDRSAIVLAPGTYSTATGEEFPIMVKKAVVLQGDPRNHGKNTIVRGSGYYISPTAARQNAAIVASHRAEGIIGITAIDPHKRGHGIWIESASPEIAHNTLTLNGNSGVCINGKSAPFIANNIFHRNGGNGVLIYGSSKPVVQDNVFEKTGFGVSALENTDSLLKGNRISGNRVGVILEGNARVTLRGNIVENSTENGLVAIARSSADVGTLQEPGGNIFRRNRFFDIQNLNSAGEAISAFGNQLNKGTKGRVELGEPAANREVDSSSAVSSPAVSNRSQPPSNNSNRLPAPKTPIPPTNSGKTEKKSSELYRVIVHSTSENEKEAVLLLYPDAFNTSYRGQSALQVGIFSNRQSAEKILQSLKEMGLKGIILTR